MEFTITKAWIDDNKTKAGSWTARQLACLSVAWQPPKGWKKRVVGEKIMLAVKERFDELAKEPVKTKPSRASK